MKPEKVQNIVITGLLKAQPVEEAGKRFVYMEASNESKDYEGETILAKALSASSDYYQRYGNIDLDHVTLTGQRENIPDYHFYEIGVPVEVSCEHKRTFVKGQIFSGEGDALMRANQFWDSLTKSNPPQRWYPSVGGNVTERDDLNKSIVTSVLWKNIGFSKTPVNLAVPTVSSIPIGNLKKAWNDGAIDMVKALTSGYETDSAKMEGGQALSNQSLESTPINYWDFRERMAKAIRAGLLKRITCATLQTYATEVMSLPHDEASSWVGKFLNDVNQSRKLRT